MFETVKSELQRIDMRPYMLSSVIFGCVLLALIYFTAVVAQVEHETQFMNYANIFRLSGAVSILYFGSLSVIMPIKLMFNMEEGKETSLSFSDPGRGKTVLLARVLIAFGFVALAMWLCTMIPVLIFAATELIVPLVADTLSIPLLLGVARMTVISLIAITAIGLFVLQISFGQKSLWRRLSVRCYCLACMEISVSVSLETPLLRSVSQEYRW